MTSTNTNIVGAAVCGALVSLLAAGSAVAEQPAETPSGLLGRSVAKVQPADVEAATPFVAVSNVRGTFTFSQDVTTPNEQIRAAFQKAAASLCDALPTYAAVDADSWSLSVGGDAAKTPYISTLGQIKGESGTQVKLMTCSCTSNAAGGGAIANAYVTGVSIAELAAKAGV
jgi:hypothetical protein